MHQRFIGIIFIISCLTLPLSAQDLPNCSARPLIADLPRVESRLWCIERPIAEFEAGELAFTAIEFMPDGALYATRPFTGELYVMRDTDGDGLVDNPQVAASGMRLPHGLVSAEDALFIMGDGAMYRFADGSLETIVDDLPHGRGFMASGITYHDGWLYAGIPMPCDFCEGANDLHGTVLKVAVDGSERAIVARGLRYPAGLTFWEGALWVTDTTRDDAREIHFGDELNRIDLTADDVPHFGFPYCIGRDNQVDLESDFDCASATAPEISLYTHSIPFNMQVYHGAAFPFLEADLLLVLAGSTDNSSIRGYQVIYLEQEEDNLFIETIIPHDRFIAGVDRVQYAGEGYQPIFAPRLNRRGAGVWAHRIFDIAVSPEGWIYISVGGGQIFALRSSDSNPCDFRNCE